MPSSPTPAKHFLCKTNKPPNSAATKLLSQNLSPVCKCWFYCYRFYWEVAQFQIHRFGTWANIDFLWQSQFWCQSYVHICVAPALWDSRSISSSDARAFTSIERRPVTARHAWIPIRQKGWRMSPSVSHVAWNQAIRRQRTEELRESAEAEHGRDTNHVWRGLGKSSGQFYAPVCVCVSLGMFCLL